MVQALLGGGNGVRPKVGTSVAQASNRLQHDHVFASWTRLAVGSVRDGLAT